MKISSAHLEAFLSIARFGSFSRAARELHLTQSALSQKIKALEQDLELTLFIRTPTGVNLTEAGNRLLRYCQVQETLEDQLMKDLKSQTPGLAGTVRIAGYSSILRSIVLPALTPLMKDNPGIRVDLRSVRVQELPLMLQRAEADFILLDRVWKAKGIAATELGHETYVMIEGHDASADSDHYLDTDPDDDITYTYFEQQPRHSLVEMKRSFFHDCYGIIDAVAAGLGRAAVPLHLIRQRNDIRQLPGFENVDFPIVLHYHQQPYYSSVQKAVLAQLENHCPSLLCNQ